VDIPPPGTDKLLDRPVSKELPGPLLKNAAMRGKTKSHASQGA
jgi:hypothetical protein